jgi:hypothetical protein
MNLYFDIYVGICTFVYIKKQRDLFNDLNEFVNSLGIHNYNRLLF